MALRDAGLRVTRPRVAVLSELSQGTHMTADEVASAVSDRIGAISTQAVYDLLAALTRAGLARRIEPGALPLAGRREWLVIEEAEVTFWGLCPACRLAS